MTPDDNTVFTVMVGALAYAIGYGLGWLNADSYWYKWVTRKDRR